ncbi:MobF family relaxase [Saccharopolyspora sp. ID03-671]|uniref:MobF family relaxase n=1 Tax=Saccharopolyspora sp. ID03-671 TaxID=3073066 RepID=UPI00324D23E4
MSPSGHEYLTGSVACGDRDLDAGESLSDYYTAHGYPPGQWFGRGATELGVDGEVTAAQMRALFGEGRHPDSDRIEAGLIAAGASPKEALEATKLGRRFPRHSEIDDLRTRVIDAYKAHNLEHDRPIGAPIDEATRARIRHDVQAQAYADAHDGTRPTSTDLKEWLAQQKKQVKNATSGYELVFAPPKSVSVAWALSDEATREQIVELHRQAVRDTLQHFEDNVAHTRKGAGGYAQYDARGITAACFEHWDSRAGDPHLHTHVPISTKVQGPDGTWTSLDGRTVLAAAVTTSEHYNSRLRDLFRQHGAAWREKPSGGIDLKRPVWELDGVPSELLAGFSQRASAVEQERARAIVEFRNTHGREPSPKDILEIGRRAQYGTRDPKQAPRTLTEHRQRWRDQAREFADPDTLTNLGHRVFGGEPETVAEVDVADLAARTLATVSDHHSHFNIWNIEAEAHRQSAHLRVPDNTRGALIAQVVEAVVRDSDTVSLQAPSLVDEPAELRRANGESVFTEHNAQRFTTHRTLREEAALAAWGRRRDGTRISTSAVEKALRGTKLNDGQAKAVRAFATSGRRVQLLYAPAGTGKTTTMRAFAEAWRAEAGTVYAFGPSARAAQELGNSIGAQPHTLHQVTTAQKFGFAGFAFPFARGDVLIVDEAAMAGTHTLHAVVSYALDRGADVRLVGDDRQLTAVEAGGAVRWFAHRNGALRLNEVVRFADPDQSKASLLLHDANPAGLDYYFEQNWVQAGSRETMRDAAHRAWRSDLDAGCPSLLIVPANDDVTALNHQARQLRLQRGDVDGTGRSVALHDGTHASTGDLVVTRRNDRLTTLFRGKDFVKNGDTWTVTAVTHSGGLKLRHHTHKATVTLPAHYVAEHVELAYATTGNRAQGMSINGNAHNLVTRGLSREQLYTQMTRAIHNNYSYVEILQHTIDSHQETPPESTAIGVMKAALKRSSAETSATEELRGALEKAESLRTLVGHHDFVAHLHTDTRIETVLTDHVPHLLDHPAAPALRQTVRTAEDLGWQAEQLIPAVLNQGPLTDTDDPAGVLQWRIAQRLIHDTPPPRLGTPTQHQLTQWRALVQHHNDTAEVGEPAWDHVWKLAAGGVDEGLDGEVAVEAAAHQLAQRPSHDPMDAHHYTANTVTAALAEQRAHGHGWNPALPWLARPETQALSEDMNDYLERLGAAIDARHTELRARVSADPPAWTASLGPRPETPEAAQRWDTVAGLAAAYRDTYTITTNDPAAPLGPRPQGNGLRARAYASIREQWRPTGHTQGRPDVADHAHVQADAVEQLRTDIDADELLRTFAEPLHQTTPEPLSVLVAQHHDLSRQLIDHVSRQALAEHAPNALGQPAEPALLATLRRAEAHGWQPDRLIARAATTRGRDHTDDLAAVLRWRIESHIADHEPPARTAEPTPDQLDRWRDIVTQHAPQAQITDNWQLLWRHAAGGAAEGLNTDAALTSAARALANRPDHDPMDAHRYTAQTLVNHLAHQRDQHPTSQAVLPWVTKPHRTLHTTNPDLGERLDELTTAIHTRYTELRDHFPTNPPEWAASLGPRPQNPTTAHTWNDVTSLAAAYRETYRINTNNPDAPLGPEPSGPTAKATAWRDITEKWSTIMTNPNPHYQQDDTLERLEALRDQIQETHDHCHDEHTEQREDYHDDSAIRRANEYDDDGLDHGIESHLGF